MNVDVVTLTLNPALDVTAEVDALVPYRKLRARLTSHEPGGGGINVARVLHRFDVGTRAVFPAGGLSGASLVAELAREGVPMEAIESAVATRESITIWVQSTGEHYRILVEGDPLPQETWRACLNAVAAGARPRFLVLSGSLPPNVRASAVAEVAEASRRLGAQFVCDSSGAALRAAVEAGADLITPNRRELHELVHSAAPLEDFDHEDAARRVVAQGARAVVVSLGAGGAFLAGDGGEEHHAAPPIRALSTVGAGDSLVAGIVIGLLRGDRLGDAVRLGVATGAATCLEHGSELAHPEGVQRLLQPRGPAGKAARP
jgi:6-phosphofructokinase 2